jgi:penicillin-binding protein 1C
VRRVAVAVGAVVAIVVLVCSWLRSVTVPSFDEVRAAYRPSDRRLLDRSGEVIHEVRVDRTVRRLRWTPLGEVSPALVEAIVHSEDRRFERHRGVDLRAVGSALAARLRGEPLRGASTISMQVAALVEPSARRRTGRHSLVAKLRQMREAVAIERRWTKAEILEAYLNLVAFRGELVGVAAGSAAFFGKAPSGIDAAEAAVLASLVRSPNAPTEVVLRRARSLVLGLASPAREADLAAAAARVTESERSPIARVTLAPQLAERLWTRLDGATSVRTTIDARAQRLAIDALRAQLLELHGRRAQDGAVLVVDNATGDVLAYVGSGDDLSSATHVDGVRGPRQAGSALKPFLYALAFYERLLTPASLVEDTPLEVASGTGVYRPENYDHDFRGLVSARTALAASLNVPAVRTALVVGVERFAAELRALGFTRVVENGDYYGPAIALGSVEVTLWELVNAYRALANGGSWSPLRLVSDEAAGVSRRVYSAETAFLVSDILADRASRSSTFGLENPLATPFWSAVKTGTSKDMRDNWCVGYSRRYTVGVWIGNFSGEPMEDVTGISGAAPAWLEILSALESGRAREEPELPAGVTSARVTFPRAVEPEREERFLAGTEPAAMRRERLACRPRILSPAAGSIVARDPDIPEDRQRVAFEAASARPSFRWVLDGRALGPARGVFLWQPSPGRHELVLADEASRPLDRVGFVVRR